MMDVNPLVGKALIQAVRICGQLATAKGKNNELHDEIRCLRARPNERSEHSSNTTADHSTWRMKKAQLVEVAAGEFFINHQQADNVTVACLHHLIKENREQLQEPTGQSGLQTGLSHMSREELVVHADARGIKVLDPRRRHGTNVQQQLIIDIQEHETARSDARIYQQMGPESMEECGFSSEFFTPHAGSSPAPTGLPVGSARSPGGRPNSIFKSLLMSH